MSATAACSLSSSDPYLYTFARTDEDVELLRYIFRQAPSESTDSPPLVGRMSPVDLTSEKLSSLKTLLKEEAKKVHLLYNTDKLAEELYPYLQQPLEPFSGKIELSESLKRHLTLIRLQDQYCLFFHWGTPLGTGSYRTYYRGFNPATGDTCAVGVAKKERFSDRQLKSIRNEKEFLTAVNGHEGFVQTKAVFEENERDPENGSIYFIQELCERGDLEQLLKKEKPSKEQRFLWAMQLTAAVAKMHGLGIAHCDLKLANILISKRNEIKIGDFGLASWIWTKKPTREEPEGVRAPEEEYDKGTPEYKPPEYAVYFSKAEVEKRDVWSTSLILTLLLQSFKYWGFEMPTSAALRDLLEQMHDEGIEKHVPEKTEGRSFYLRGLQTDPHERCTSQELASLVNECAFSSVGLRRY